MRRFPIDLESLAFALIPTSSMIIIPGTRENLILLKSENLLIREDIFFPLYMMSKFAYILYFLIFLPWISRVYQKSCSDINILAIVFPCPIRPWTMIVIVSSLHIFSIIFFIFFLELEPGLKLKIEI